MQEWLTGFIGTRVTFAQTDNTRLFGKIIAVNDDYATLLMRSGEHIHVPYRHVKFVVTNHSDLAKSADVPECQLANRFIDLIRSLASCMVRIDCAGNHASGVLGEVRQDGIRLIQSMNETTDYNLSEVCNVCLLRSDAGDETSSAPNDGAGVASGRQRRSQPADGRRGNAMEESSASADDPTWSSAGDVVASVTSDHPLVTDNGLWLEDGVKRRLHNIERRAEISRHQDSPGDAGRTVRPAQSMPQRSEDNKMPSSKGTTASLVLFNTHLTPDGSRFSRHSRHPGVADLNDRRLQLTKTRTSAATLYKNRRYVPVSEQPSITPVLVRHSVGASRIMSIRGIQ